MRAIFACIVLSGCAGFGTPNLSPEQLKAAASDKNASVVCAVGTGPWGKVVSTYVNVDKSAVANGTVTVDAECKTTITTADKVK